MKTTIAALGIGTLMLCSSARGAVKPDVTVSDLELNGRIEGENVTFVLSFAAEVARGGASVPLVEGEVACLSDLLPARTELSRQGKRLLLTFTTRGRQQVEFKFASLPVKEGDWRQTRFRIPDANVRRLSMVLDREDLDVQFPGALRVDNEGHPGGQAKVTAFLGASDEFQVRWKPDVRKLDADVAVACDANTLVVASVGALRMDTLFTYRIVQGALSRLVLELPPEVNVTQVSGSDILEWGIEEADGERRLTVSLNQPYEDLYRLRVESELALPAFPARFELPVVRPADVIRASGFLLVGTDSAIKILVHQAMGLTQVDQDAFPRVELRPDAVRLRPSRSVFAYQFANMPYTLGLSAEDIVTAFHGQERMTLALRDNDLVFHAAVELEVRDAPAREIAVETEPGWTVANVSGKSVADYDVRDEAGRRVVLVTFREAVLGRVLFDVRLERSLADAESRFSVPRFHVRGAGTERGYVALVAEEGLRLVPVTVGSLREVPTDSLPTRVPGARQAFRFKGPGWELVLDVQTATAAVHSEIFHLVSLGEGAVYGSCSLTYHVSGAPVRRFQLSLPESYQNVEFVGRGLRGWEQDGPVWTVWLQEKALGDYTLLVTYDQQFNFEGDELLVGGVSTVGTDSEVGYIALAGTASLGLEGEPEVAPSVIRIDSAEIPSAYALLINDPILQAYKYVRPPHAVVVKVKRYPTQPLLSKVTDHATLSTRISREGEVVTTAMYFVKNTSDQYLAVTLPAGAKLWATEVDEAAVQALDVAGKAGTILIPLRRHRDPNRPSRVELVYAESRDALGLRRSMTLHGPVSAAQAVFTQWTIAVPASFAVLGTGGNLMEERSPPTPGLGALLSGVLRAYTHLVTAGAGWFLAGVTFLVVGCLIAFNLARGRGLSWGSLAGLALLGLTLLLALRFSPGLPSILRSVAFPTFPDAAPCQASFTKVVTPADSELSINLRIVPWWMGAAGSFFGLLAGGLVGLALVLRSIGQVRARPMRTALGLTAITWGLTRTVLTLQILTAVAVAVLPLAFLALALRSAYRAGRRHLAAHPASAEDPPPLIQPGMEAVPGGREGAAAVWVLLVLLAVIPGAVSVFAGASAADRTQGEGKVAEEVPEAPVMSRVEISVDAPGPGQEKPLIARVHAVLTFDVQEPVSFLLLAAPHVLTDYELGSRNLSVRVAAEGYVLEAQRRGTYTVALDYLAEVEERCGAWWLCLPVPENLRNQVVFRLPATDMDVQSLQAVLLKTEAREGATEATLVFGPAREASISWRPQVRRTALEEAVFFCEMNTLAAFEPGVANLTHWVRYQVARGEIQELRLDIPQEMSVTAVMGNSLSTWRFDPETHSLEAWLEKPVSGEFALTVVTQIPREGLPYEAAIALPSVRGALRQRGALAIAAPEKVQVRVGTLRGLDAMNIDDFPAPPPAAAPGAAGGETPAIKRSFRYQQLPATVTVQAEEVVPEVRVTEQASLDISDERIVLSSRLEVSIARSGVFSLSLAVPDDYDVESLSGEDVSHWDERKEGGRTVQVHFNKQVLGTRTLNLVLARTEKGIGQEVLVPRVRLAEARKHTGTLAVSGERGVRFMTVRREGVSEINPTEIGIHAPGYLAFRLLRPGWMVALKTEVRAPVVKAEVLHRVDLSQGMIQGHASIRYQVENAGVKTFYLAAPRPGTALTVQGRDIAQVQPVDGEEGVWKVELHNKVENTYALEVTYQDPFNPDAEEIQVPPLKTLRTDAQKGYLVVMSRDRLRVRARSVASGLKPEDARRIPRSFGVEDLSNAILCYRTTHPNYWLGLSVVRHESAATLPATVDKVRLTSVVSDDDQMVTRAVLDLVVGDLRFLETVLPRDSRIWSTFVNGKAVSPLLEAGALLVPLDEVAPGETTSVELIYAGPVSHAWLFSREVFPGPKFNLPLADIAWSLYLPPSRRYYGFGGTLQFEGELGLSAGRVFDAESYAEKAEREGAHSLRLAEDVLKQGERFAREGKQRAAKKAFEAAMNYSIGQEDFNEDARIQYRNLAKQQAIVGLVNRRADLKRSWNVHEETSKPMEGGIDEGEWTPEYGQQVAQSLSSKDSDSLGTVAERILDQQAAAAGLAPALRVTLPQRGRQLAFRRALQIKPLADMTVVVRSSTAWKGTWFVSLLAAAGFLALYRAGLAFAGAAR